MYKSKIRSVPILIALLLVGINTKCQRECITQCSQPRNNSYDNDPSSCKCDSDSQKSQYKDLVFNFESLNRGNNKVDNMFKQLAYMSNNDSGSSQWNTTYINYQQEKDQVKAQEQNLTAEKENCQIKDDCDLECVKTCLYDSDQSWDQCYPQCNCEQQQYGFQYERWESAPSSYDAITTRQLTGERFGNNFMIQGGGKVFERTRGVKFGLAASPITKCGDKIPPIKENTCTNETILVNNTIYVEKACPTCPIQKECQKCNTTICPSCPIVNTTNQTKVCPQTNCSQIQNQTCKNTTIEVKVPCPDCPVCAKCPVQQECPEQEECEPFYCPTPNEYCNQNPYDFDCLNPTNCPPPETCPECDTEESEQNIIIIRKINIQRVAAISVTNFIIKTQYSNIFRNVSIYDITKEFFSFDFDNQFTVQYKFNNQTFFVEVKRMDGFDNVFIAFFVLNDVKERKIVVVDVQADGTFNTAVLESEKLETRIVQTITVFREKTSITGFNYQIKESNRTQTLSKIITIIVERFQKLIIIKRNIISAAQSGCLHTYLQVFPNDKQIKFWNVYIIEFTQQATTAKVQGVDANHVVIVEYRVIVDENNDHPNVFKVDVTTKTNITTSHDIIVYSINNSPYNFYNVIIKSNQVSGKYSTSIQFKGQYFQVSWTTFETIIQEIKIIIEKFTQITETQIVYHESNAAVAALVRWVLEMKETDVELQTTQESDTQSQVKITSLINTKGPWTVSVRVIQFTEQATLYYCRLRYPSGNVVGYFVLVDQTGPMRFDVSVLFEGSTILVTYRVELQQLKQTNIIRITTCSVIDSSKQITKVDQFQDTAAVNKTTTSLTSSQSNSTITSTVNISNKTVIEKITKTHTYRIYEHPINGNKYWLFDNNTVIDAQTKQIVSLNGGVSWIIQFFTSSIKTTQKADYVLFIYTTTGEQWRIYKNGSVYIEPTGEWVSNGGINTLITIITDRGQQTLKYNITYTVYRIEGTETKYKVFEDGTVTNFNDNVVISREGLKGLIQYLSKSITTYQAATYQIAIDKSTGTQYFVYPDGKVTHIDGSIVCTNGIQGLTQYLMTTVITSKITSTTPDYQLAYTNDGKVYYMYSNGRITKSDGSFVCDGGINGLKQYLISKQTNITTTTLTTIITKTVVPQYNIFTYNEETYIIYANQTIIKQSNGEFITNRGFEGFQEWIVKKATSTQVSRISYKIVQYEQTGEQYYVYDNNTVTTSRGSLICLDGGMECLKEHLYAKADERVVQVSLRERIEEQYTFEVKVYIDNNGTEYWIDQEGHIFNQKTKSLMHIFDKQCFIDSLTYNRFEKQTKTLVYYIAEVEGSAEKYRVYEDGGVFTINRKFMTSGGTNGLIKYLTVKKLVILQQKGDQIIVDIIEKEWEFKQSKDSYYFVDHKDDDKYFCQTNTIEDALDCLTSYLSIYYYKQILQASSDTGVRVIIDGYYNEYNLYATGIVTDQDNYKICDTGIQCLYEYIRNKYNLDQEVKVFTTYKPIEEKVEFRYWKYENIETEREYYLYSNQSMYDVNNKIFLTRDQYLSIIHNLTYIGKDKSYFNITYTPQYIKGYTKEAETNPNYNIHHYDGSVWYKNKYFLINGKEEALRKYVQVKKNMKFSYSDSWIHVPAINKRFQYLQTPDRLVDQDRNEICRTEGYQGAYSCLIAYLSKHYYEQIVNIVPTEQFNRITLIDGSEYYIFQNGTVTTSSGKFVIQGGIQEFVKYLLSKKQELTIIKIQQEIIPEVKQKYVMKSGNGNYSYFDNETLRNDDTNQWLNNSLNLILNVNLTFVGFEKLNNSQEVTYVRDNSQNDTYKITKDGKVYSEKNELITGGGLLGLRAWIQVNANVRGVANKTTIVFDEFNKLTYDIITIANYFKLIERTTNRLAVLPRENKEEVYNLVQDDLLRTKRYILKHDLIYQFKIVQDNNRNSYMVFDFGLVLSNDGQDKVICSGKGDECLARYLRSQNLYLSTVEDLGNFEVFLGTNGEYYLITLKGGIYTFPDRTLIAKEGKDQLYLNQYINQQQISGSDIDVEYMFYQYNGVSYFVYADGRVTFQNKTIVCQEGGLECLRQKMKLITTVTTNSTSYKLYRSNVDNAVYRVYVTGRVSFDNNNTVVCATGGYDCFYDYISQKAKITSYSIVSLSDGRVFYVDANGKVTNKVDQSVICEKGGIPCLKTYIEQSTPVTVTANGELFYMFKNGTVLFKNNEVLCYQGGQLCLKQYIEDNYFSTFTYNQIVFKIYGNGKVTKENGEIVCVNGGEECLQEYLISLRYQIINAGDVVYRLYSNSSVIKESTGQIICKEGGVPCLREYLTPQYQLLTHNSITYKVHNNGKVETDEGKLICSTGGQQCLQEYIASITPTVTSYTINNVEYQFNIYQNGVVTLANGTQICSGNGGGVEGLKQWIMNQTAQEVNYQILDKNYIFRIYGDGRVITSEGFVITQTGGVDSLRAWIADQSPQSIKFGDQIFYLYQSGKVTDQNMKVICSKGGQQCLEDWIASSTPQLSSVKIGSVTYNFHIYQNGTVIDLLNNSIITKTGGQEYLQQWLNDKTPQEVQFTIDGQVQVYKLYSNGKVEDNKGKVVCQTGGQECLKTYAQQFVPTQMTYTINGVAYLYNIYNNGTVIDVSTKKVVCSTGGQTCLEKYAQSLLNQVIPPTKLWLQQQEIEQSSDIFQTVSSKQWIMAIMFVVIMSLIFAQLVRQNEINKLQKVDREEREVIIQALKESLLGEKNKVQAC